MNAMRHRYRGRAAVRPAVVLLAALLALLAPAPAPAAALVDGDLYRATAFVTGTEEPERSRGFREALEQVFVKLTGDASLAGSPRLTPTLDAAADLVATFAYEDRMKGIPVHDEQGTRERPHFLHVTFHKGKLDGALRALGLRKWPADRPVIAVFLAVRDARRGYLLTRAGAHGYGQRAVLASVSAKRGVPVALPVRDSAAAWKAIRDKAVHKIWPEVRALHAECLLFGTLDLNRSGSAWDMAWTFACRDQRRSWSLNGVSFDRALRSGLERAAKVLSRSAVGR